MSDFIYDVRDLKFILKKWLDMDKLIKGTDRSALEYPEEAFVIGN